MQICKITRRSLIFKSTSKSLLHCKRRKFTYGTFGTETAPDRDYLDENYGLSDGLKSCFVKPKLILSKFQASYHESFESNPIHFVSQ